MQDPRVVGDAIDAACDKIDRLRAELTEAGVMLFNQAKSIKTLTAELAECRKDAERYRWLRDQCRYGNLTIALCTSFELQPWGGDDTDKAIDTARKGEGE